MQVEPRINVITIAVDDLKRALNFYRDGLGLKSAGIVASEHLGDEVNAAGAIAMFHLGGGLIFSVYPRTELAKDASVPLDRPTSGAFSLGHAVANREEVDSVLSAAQAAGATLTGPARDRPWGIYSGYFKDPDGHLWEVLWNPGLDMQPHP